MEINIIVYLFYITYMTIVIIIILYNTIITQFKLGYISIDIIMYTLYNIYIYI